MNTFATISVLYILAAVILATLIYGKLNKALKVFCWFLFLSGAIQFTALLLNIVGTNNMPLLHIYVVTGLPCLVWFYKTILSDFINPKILWGIALVFVPYSVLNSLFVQDIFRFNSNALVAESIIVIILALFTFIFLMNSTMKETAIKDTKSLNWINSGLFIYYLSCLLIFHFGDTILFHTRKNVGMRPWILHSFFSIVMYTCFIVGLWKHSKIRNS